MRNETIVNVPFLAVEHTFEDDDSMVAVHLVTLEEKYNLMIHSLKFEKNNNDGYMDIVASAILIGFRQYEMSSFVDGTLVIDRLGYNGILAKRYSRVQKLSQVLDILEKSPAYKEINQKNNLEAIFYDVFDKYQKGEDTEEVIKKIRGII